MDYDVIVAGAGMAGLTAAAYLCEKGRSVLVLEQADRVGGLVGSFEDEGFVFDQGIRALENSGVLFPMLRQLGIDLSWVDSPVSLGVAGEILDIQNEQSLAGYGDMLNRLFPGRVQDVARMVEASGRMLHYMDVLYGIDNPLFMDIPTDREYLFHTLLPWMGRFFATVGKISRYDAPVYDYLAQMTSDRALQDIVAQHFFQETPAFFALSYFSLYLDYHYPKGGTQTLVDAMERFVTERGGVIRTGARIDHIQANERTAGCADGSSFCYRNLIWCADQKGLYRALDASGLAERTVRRIEKRKDMIHHARGCDSVLTLYLKVSRPPSYFKARHNPHLFYTPKREGIRTDPIGRIRDGRGGFIQDRREIEAWLTGHIRTNTFEISVPAMRDPNLAPPGSSGLIVSLLLDVDLVRHVRDMGWYEDMKTLCADVMIETLANSIYPGLDRHVTGQSVSTPLTIASRTLNTDGAITGWAFTNPVMPATHRMLRIKDSVRTPVPHLLQAGQWTYSPAGLPIAIMTGKLAADRSDRLLRRRLPKGRTDAG